MKNRITLDEEAQALSIIRQRRGVLLWTRQSDNRWYRMACYDDLVTQGILQLQWGGPVKRKGCTKIFFVFDLPDEKLADLVHQICMRRRAHGYDVDTLDVRK